MLSGSVASKVRDWLNRYGVAECAGITCALVVSFVVHRVTRSAIATGYAGAWGESIGYAGVIGGRDLLAASRSARAKQRRMGPRSIGELVANWIAEFGPSGLLDTFAVRPFTMGFGVHLFGPTRGIIAGKVTADIIFYIPVIFIYERRKRLQREPGGPP